MDIDSASKRYGELYIAALDQQKHDEAKQISRDAVQFFKQLLKDEAIAPSLRNAALYHAVMFRGLFDYADLVARTAAPNWKADQKSIEAVWRNMCDCRDRIGFVAGVSSGKIFAKIFSRLDHLEEWFADQFGNGVYSSPEILVKSELCSICCQDIRRCDHIAGDVYDGRICHGVPQDISLESSSIVQVPHDRRCRIWPWQMKDGVASGIILFTLFRVDDFVEGEDWHQQER